jgi:hypothetical protein
MKRIIVQYRVRPDRVTENVTAIEAVFEELERAAPPGLRYASFMQEDGVTFVHVVSIETTDGSNPLATIAAFKTFVDGVKERTDVAPVARELREVGSYRFLEDRG